MAFDRLKAMGEVRFTKITGDLIRGESAMGLARTIQQEWHEFNDVAEKTLTQQLNRLRLSMLAGSFGPEKQAKLEKLAAPKKLVETLKGFATIDSLNAQEMLLSLQVGRIQRLVEKEKAMPVPIAHLDKMMETANTLNVQLQKQRFELGLDQYHVGPGMSTSRAASIGVTLPDGTHVQKQVYEALESAEAIMAKNGIGGRGV